MAIRKGDNRYQKLIEKIFFSRYKQGATLIEFERKELEQAAKVLQLDLPKNLGDVFNSL